MESSKYIFGIHPIIEAMEAGKKIEKILIKSGVDGQQYHRILAMARDLGIPVQYVPEERLYKLVKGRHQGILAYLPQIEYSTLETIVESALKSESAPIIFLLDGVSDVRNLGAIARSADCAGVNGIILPAKGGAAINAEAIKASAGALMRVPTAKVSNLRAAIFYLIDSGFQIVAATEKSEMSIYDVDFKRATAVIMGSEDKGVSSPLLKSSDLSAKIPLVGNIGSLNVSVAASIVMFEALRQRGV